MQKKLIFISLILLNACQVNPINRAEEDSLSRGAADNFYSNVAQEYQLNGVLEIEVEDAFSEEQRLARATELMNLKSKIFAWFLHVYLIDKSSPNSPAGAYGGLRAMILDGSLRTSNLAVDTQNPRRYTFNYSLQIGGAKDLIERIRRDQRLPDSTAVFNLALAKLSNEQLKNFSASKYQPGRWAPSTCNCEIENVSVSITALTSSLDAYLDYAGLLADNELTIAAHFGWDYDGRLDLASARELYERLVNDWKFNSPSTSFENYHRLSGPLTKKVQVASGREVLVKIFIFHPDPCTAWDERQGGEDARCADWVWPTSEANANPTTEEGAANMIADLRESLRTREVIIYSGHSGYQYGYALSSWHQTRGGQLDPAQIIDEPLPADQSQIFMFNGCETYHVAQAFKENKSKPGLKNSDVITTTSFSVVGDLSPLYGLLTALIGEESGKFSAYKYSQLMELFNPNLEDTWRIFTMYGAHGLDDNPMDNPLLAKQ